MLNRIKYAVLPKELKKRWSYDDFLAYRMQEMNKSEIDELATEDELWNKEKQLNSDEFRYIFNDKHEFYRRFASLGTESFIKRDILFLEDATYEQLVEFCQRHKKIVLKPVDKYAGLGIRIVETSIETIAVDEFEKLKSERYIAEEYIYQAREYEDIYSQSLNTVRVTTYINDAGEADILFAVNQFGQKGSLVDNHDEAAIWAAIDITTGAVVAAEVEAFDGRVYDVHPDTGATILGFANPCWKEISELALKLAGVVPECRLIGWDIAVREDYSLEVIEGNVTPELNLYQSISGRGLRKVLDI